MLYNVASRETPAGTVSYRATPGAGRPRPLVKTWSLEIAGDVKRVSSALAAGAGAWTGVVWAASLVPDSHAAEIVRAIPAFCLLFLLLLSQGRDTGFALAEAREIGRIALAAAVALVLAMLVAAHPSSLDAALAADVALTALMATACAAGMALVTGRLCASRWIKPYLSRNIAIYGVCPDSERVFEEIRRSRIFTYAGLFEDRARDRIPTPVAAIDGGLDDLVGLIAQGHIDEVVITLPRAATDRIAHIAKRLQQYPVDVHVCTNVGDEVAVGVSGIGTTTLGTAGLVKLQSRPIRDWGVIVKALEDRVLGGLMLAALSPLLVFIALAIKLDSRGPVFFRQRRHGVSGQSIVVWKFRTMRVMEDGGEVKQATKGDPRVTRVGRLLRASSLDELPQLINVLTGEMSLVGPRPHAEAHDEYYARLIATYVGRHQVKPGITGWAQINGLRGETRTPELMAQRIEHDIWYIRNWSLWLDLKIIVLTPIYGLVHKNAY